MLAVVLVGGFGTRMRPLTHSVPKPMLPIANRPMIVRLVERLAAGGVTDVVLALGFKPEPFAAAFPGDRLGDVTIHYAVEPEPLDTAGAIAFAARAVGVTETFVVANGDIVTDVSVAALVARHRELGVSATIHLTPVADPSAFGVVEAGADGLVTRFVEKPAPGDTTSHHINAGTYVLEPDVLDLIPSGQPVSIERDTFPRLVDQGRLGSYPTDHYWIDAGRPDSYLAANLDLIGGRRGTPEPAIHADAFVDGAAVVRNSVVGERVVVAEGATVIDSVLLPGSLVAGGTLVERSLVAGQVEAGAHLADCVVGSGYVVVAGSHHHGDRLPADG